MRQVGVERLERLEGMRVDGLGHEHPTGTETAAAELEQFLELGEAQVLNHLSAEHRRQRRRCLLAQELERVDLIDAVAFVATVPNHVRIEVHAARGDTRLLEEIEHLAAAAPEIDDARPLPENGQIHPLPIADERLRTAEGRFKSDIEAVLSAARLDSYPRRVLPRSSFARKRLGSVM